MQIVNIKQKSKSKRKENILGLSMISIHYIGFIVFTLVPLIMSFVMAFSHFKEYSYKLSDMTWTGLDNFKFIFTETNTVAGNESPLIWKALGNTFFLCLSIPFEIFLGLAFAQLLKSKIKGKKFFRVVFYMPYICSIVAVAFVWKFIFNGEDVILGADGNNIPYGLVNQILHAINPSSEPILFTWDAKWCKIILILMTLWSVLGYDMLLFQAALENIDKSIYEAADIDGASKIKQFFKITIPLATPTIFFLLITCVIGALQSYTKMDSLITYKYSQYGEGNSALTLVAYIMYYMTKGNINYKNINGEIVKGISGMGVACAATVFLTAIIAVITFINRKLSDKWVFYNE